MGADQLRAVHADRAQPPVSASALATARGEDGCGWAASMRNVWFVRYLKSLARMYEVL